MTLVPGSRLESTRQVLLSCGQHQDVAGWLGGVDELLAPSGVSILRTHTRPDTVRQIERGGLGAAVVCADDPWVDALSVLGTIRSMDHGLPCWLVTKDTTRQMFQRALSLDVTSVITHPDRVSTLARSLSRVFVDWANGN